MAKQTTHEKVLSRLRDDSGGLRRRGVEIALDTLLDRELATLFDPAELARLAVQMMTADNANRLVDRHVHAGRARWTTHVKATGEKPSDFISAATMPKLEKIVSEAKLPKGDWARDAVDPTLLRQLLAPIIQDTLVSFASRLPLPGLGGSSSPEPEKKAQSTAGAALGFLGSRMKAEVEKRAGGILDAGKSIVGGLTSEVEHKMQSIARDFSMSAQTEIKNAFESRLRSAEGKQILGKLRLQLLKKAMSTKLAEFDADTQRLPWKELLGLAGEIAAHNATRPEVPAWIEGEVKALLEIEAGRTLRMLLDEAGMLDAVRESLLTHVNVHAEQVVKTDAFAAWLSDLLA